jgi:hypothetical protein
VKVHSKVNAIKGKAGDFYKCFGTWKIKNPINKKPLPSLQAVCSQDASVILLLLVEKRDGVKGGMLGWRRIGSKIY